MQPIYEKLKTSKAELDFIDSFENLIDENAKNHDFDPKQNQMSSILKDNGYDLLITRGKEILVYDPSQIQILEKIPLREMYKNRLEQLEESAMRIVEEQKLRRS